MKTISTEQEKNTEVLEQLQEYAQLYFDAIIEANTTDGECKIKIGKYTARELVSMDRDYELPRDTMFDEDITIEAGSFRCTIQYRQIFYILAKWEQMMRAGKQKAVFEVGEAEEKSAKVLLQETTPTGRYKEKRVRMQRITGNWWASRKADRDGKFALYYELNGVIFLAKYWSEDPQSESTKKWCAEYGDAGIEKLVIDFLANFPESKSYGYYSEVARRANIKEGAEHTATATETPQISTEAAETVNCTTEGGNARNEQNLAVCRHVYENVIYNYGSIENFIEKKNTEIQKAQMELQSYYDNCRKGRTRRTSIIAGLENALHTMKHQLSETIRELKELQESKNKAPQPPETPQTNNNATALTKHSQMSRKRPQTVTLNRPRLTLESASAPVVFYGIILPAGICCMTKSPPSYVNISNT